LPKLDGVQEDSHVGEETIQKDSVQSVSNGQVAIGDASVFDEWVKRQGWRKLFMPKPSSAKWVSKETVTLFAGRTQVHEMAVEEKRENKEILPKDIDGYSTDFDYVPPTFKSERITLLEKHTILDCRGCDGSGQKDCPEEQTCSRCSGKGRNSRHCRDCSGTGKETRQSRTSYKETGVLWDTEYASSTTSYQVDCNSCDATGWIHERCGSCRGTGDVRCSKCQGKGWVTCKRCKGGGEVVDATILQRSFTTKTSEKIDEERVPAKYLKGLRGQPISENDDVTEGLVKRLETLEGFPVDVQACAFGKREFQVLRIRGADETRLRAPGHPWVWHALFS